MRDGYLTDGDTSALARQALDLLDPRAGLRVAPDPGYWPVRSGGTRSWSVWPQIEGCGRFGVPVPAAAAPVQVLAELVSEIGRRIAESPDYPGAPFPVCPGHDHAASVAIDGAEVVLSCPDSDEEVGRITPCVP